MSPHGTDDTRAVPARTDPAPTAPLPSPVQVGEALHDATRAPAGVGTYGTGGQPLRRSINRPVADRPRTPPPVGVADRCGATTAHQTLEGPSVAALEAASRTRKAKRLRHEHRMDVYAEIRSGLVILLLVVMVLILASTGVQVFGVLAGWWALPWAGGR